MFRILVQKELKTIIQSPKFVTTFLTCSILILLSVYVGIQDYNYSLNKYIAAQNLVKNEMETASAWSELENKIYRKPNPLQIFSAGINNDLGRFSLVARFKDVKLESSSYSEDPIFAFFRYLDFTFIVTIVLSLFAILFTYDSVNGEKESGTLKLVFSNSIPRSKFLGAKFLGSWLGLIIPVSIPVLISILFLLLFNISLTSPQWLTLILYIITSFGYFTFFIALGIMFSSFTKTSSSSFLISLVAWISFVFIILRIGTMLAGQFVDIPSIAEIENMKDSFSKAKLNEQFEKIEQLKLKRENEIQGMSESEKEIYKEEKEWEWMKEESAIT
ncbi:MAG: ABC transporter permease subunit, partial [Melioribacteraceae bacterium]